MVTEMVEDKEHIMRGMLAASKIAVVIPCYKVKDFVLDVIGKIPAYVERIYVVDDACPDHTGRFVIFHGKDPRVLVMFNPKNTGVGGAVMKGYSQAIADGAEVIVKIDGDGQMDPALLPFFVKPILAGNADYTKGNRFFNLEKIQEMPKMRLFGNAVLSFITKASSGYWQIFDPTNGYTAIHADVARYLNFEKIDPRYFFESDILFRLNTLRAVVSDVAMDAKYEQEISQLEIKKILMPFIFKNIRNFCKRIFYNYYLRDLSLASIELPVGLALFAFGLSFGSHSWMKSMHQGIAATSGTVMLSGLALLMGINFIMAFLNYDIAFTPKQVLHKTCQFKTSKTKSFNHLESVE